MNWKPSDHFPDMNWEEIIEYAKQPGKAVRKRIGQQCPVALAAGHMRKYNVKRYYLFYRPLKVVFVCTYEGHIVTAFPYTHGVK